MHWTDFETVAAELAAFGRERIEERVVMLGTLRRSGWPRLTPIEPLFLDEHLYLGMMSGSKKAADLLRDPRCTLHNPVTQRDGTEGEFKAYGRAVPATAEQWRRLADHAMETLGWRLPEGAHEFWFDIEEAALVQGPGLARVEIWHR